MQEFTHVWQILSKALYMLYEGYIKDGPGKIYEIHASDLDNHPNFDELGATLLEEGYIANLTTTPSGFSCSITWLGVSMSDEFFYVDYMLYIRGTIIEKPTEWFSILEILHLEPISKYLPFAKDIAYYMESSKLIKYDFTENDVLVQAADRAIHYYDNEDLPF